MCARFKSVLDDMDRMILVVSAVIHDLDHLGRTNPFLVNSHHRLALLYNDVYVMTDDPTNTCVSGLPLLLLSLFYGASTTINVFAPG